MTVESGLAPEPNDKRSLTTFQKTIFITLTFLTVVTIFVLINFSNMTEAEKEKQSLQQFKQMSKEYMKNFGA